MSIATDSIRRWLEDARRRLAAPIPSYLGILFLIALLALNIFGNGGLHHGLGSGFGVPPDTLRVEELVRKVKMELSRLHEDQVTRNEAAVFDVRAFDLELNFVVSSGSDSKVRGGPAFLVTETGMNFERSVVQKLTLHMVTLPAKSDSVSGDTGMVWPDSRNTP